MGIGPHLPERKEESVEEPLPRVQDTRSKTVSGKTREPEKEGEANAHLFRTTTPDRFPRKPLTLTGSDHTPPIRYRISDLGRFVTCTSLLGDSVDVLLQDFAQVLSCHSEIWLTRVAACELELESIKYHTTYNQEQLLQGTVS